MLKQLIEKIDLPVIIIAFLLLCYSLSDNNKEGLKNKKKKAQTVNEFFKKAGKAIVSVAKQAGNAIQKGMSEFIEKIKDISPDRVAKKLRGPFDGVGEIFKKGVSDAGKGAKKLGSELEGPILGFLKKMKRLLYGYVKIIKGIGITFFGVQIGTWLGFGSAVKLIEHSSEYFITNFMCLIRFLLFFPACAFFYLADMVGMLLYLPITIVIEVLYVVTHLPVHDLENYVWKQIRAHDNVFYKKQGFYLTRWPKIIRDQCYNCKRLKHQVLADSADVISKYNRDVIYPVTTGGLDHIIDGTKDMWGIISDILHGR